MKRASIALIAALSLAGCAASPAPPKIAAAPITAVAVSTGGPEIPAAPAPPSQVDASPSALTQDLEAINARFNEAGLTGAVGLARAPVAPEAFRIEDLPQVTLPDPLDAATAPTTSGGDPATELVPDWKSSSSPLGLGKGASYTSVRVGMSHGSGKLRIGNAEGTVGPDGAGGPFVSCGGPATSARKLVPARWEIVEANPKGGLDFKVVNAWFDTQTCTAAVVARVFVTTRRLAGGMIYAFRSRGAGAAQDEVLSLVGPRFAHLSTGAIGGDASVQVNDVTRISLPIRKGGGASIMGRVAPTMAAVWMKVAGLEPVSDSRDLVVGVEVSQGVEDPAPLAIAYLGMPGVNTKTAQTGQFRSNSELLDPFLRK